MSSVAYVKRWRLDREQGITHAYIPLERVREHVEQLLADGMSKRAIAQAAGVSPSTLTRVTTGRNHAGEQAGLQRAVAERILRVHARAALHRPNPRDFVPAVGARRRIMALLALGWRHSDISAHLPAGGTSSALVLHQAGQWVAVQTHEAVCAAYDALSMRPGPSDTTRARARRLGYLPPLAWDDAALDSASAVPAMAVESTDDVDELAVERAVNGIPTRLTRAERLVALERLVPQGLSDRAIGQRLGVTDKTVIRDRQALGLATRWTA